MRAEQASRSLARRGDEILGPGDWVPSVHTLGTAEPPAGQLRTLVVEGVANVGP
jgi:hypothetical protein